MICANCTKANLKQDYPNTIHCPYCKSKWTNFRQGGETMEVSVEYIYLGILAMLGVGGVIAIINKRKDYQPRPDEPKKQE